MNQKLLRGTVSVTEVLRELQKEEGFLDKKSASTFSCCSARELMNAEDLPRYQPGKKILFKKSELIAWIESHRVYCGKKQNDLLQRVLVDIQGGKTK